MRLTDMVPRRRPPARAAEEGPRVFGEGRAITAANRYGLYALSGDILHRPAAKKVAEGDVYEPDTIEFIRNRCGTGDVVHAGTFFGDFLPGLSAGLAPGALLWAFEPNPESHALAAATVALNRLPNVRLANAALTEAAARLPMRVRTADGTTLGGASRLVRGTAANAAETVEVAGVPVDEAVPADRAVAILQLDVEGHEKPALRGARATIARCRPLLILEYFEDHDFVARIAPGLGYRPVGRLHSNTVFAPGA